MIWDSQTQFDSKTQWWNNPSKNPRIAIQHVFFNVQDTGNLTPKSGAKSIIVCSTKFCNSLQRILIDCDSVKPFDTCSTIWRSRSTFTFVYLTWSFTTSTMVNHHEKTPFGRTFFVGTFSNHQPFANLRSGYSLRPFLFGHQTLHGPWSCDPTTLATSWGAKGCTARTELWDFPMVALDWTWLNLNEVV